MYDVERGTVVATAGKPEIFRRQAGHPLDRLLGTLNLAGLGCAADRPQLVAGTVKGRMRVAVVADLKVRVRCQPARLSRVDLSPHTGHEDGGVDIGRFQVAGPIGVDPAEPRAGRPPPAPRC